MSQLLTEQMLWSFKEKQVYIHFHFDIQLCFSSYFHSLFLWNSLSLLYFLSYRFGGSRLPKKLSVAITTTLLSIHKCNSFLRQFLRNFVLFVIRLSFATYLFLSVHNCDGSNRVKSYTDQNMMPVSWSKFEKISFVLQFFCVEFVEFVFYHFQIKTYSVL